MFNNLFQTLKYEPGLFEFGKIEALEYTSEGEEDVAAVETTDEEYVADEVPKQDLQFTGYVKVKLFTDQSIVRALFVVPLAGRSMFMGGIPERGSVCLMVSMRQQNGFGNQRIIIGFVPIPVNMMIAGRKELNNLKEGEIRIQPSTYDEHAEDFFSGATAHFDIYGRLIIESGDDNVRVVYGDLLSDEYTDDVAIVKDAITGEAITISEKYKDNFSRTVDKKGNTIYRVLSEIWDCQGDSIRRINGNFIVSTVENIKLDRQGSFLQISDEGFQIVSMKDVFLKAIGNITMNSGSYVAISAFLDLALTASNAVVIKCLKEMLISAGDQVTIASASAKILIKAFTNVEIKATQNFDMQATMNAVSKAQVDHTVEAGVNMNVVGGVKVNLGSASASEALVKGTTFLPLINAHMHTGNLGFPTSPPVTPFAPTVLSLKTFTE